MKLQQLIGLKTYQTQNDLNIDLKAGVKAACEGSETPPFTKTKVGLKDLPAIKDYLKDVAADTLPYRLAQEFADAGINPAEALAAVPAVKYLQEALPTSEFELTPTGLRRVIAPSKSQDFQFLWKCRVVENAYYILELFSNRMLTKFDMDCLKKVHQEEFSAMSSEFISYIMDNYGADADIPRSLRLMLAIFFDQPTIKLEQVAAYKSADKAPKPPPAPAEGKSPNISQQEIK